MKKFFAFVAAALVAFGFASCNGNNPADKNFKIEVSEITATTATVIVTPADTTVTYYWGVAKTAELAKMADDTLFAYTVEAINYYVELYSYLGYEYTFEDFLSKGVDSHKYEELEANTEYTVYAFQLDANGVAKGGVAKKAFKTAEAAPVSKIGEETVVIEGAILTDYCEKEGWWQLQAYNADTTKYFTFSPMEALQLAGTWALEDMDKDFTYVADANNEYAFETLNLITDVEGETFILTGKGLAADGIEYTFNISASTAEEEGDGVAAPKKARAAKAAPAFSKYFRVKK